MGLYTEKLLPTVARGLEAAGRPKDAIDRMIEIKLSYNRAPRTLTTPWPRSSPTSTPA